MAVVIETTIGDFTVDLYFKERPQTCRNFLKLCKIKYYNWNLFFSVQSNFIAQTGDPTATGKGGESIYGIVLGEQARYYEAEKIPKIKHDKAGLISMVNCGDNMLGSQFFLTLGADLLSLDGQHCVFGEITEGLEIILKLNETFCDESHRPFQDIRISHTVIIDDPFDDPKGLVIPDRSPSPTRECLESDRIGADEDIDDTAGMTAEEIVEMQKEKEAKARATILEIVGDLPDAEMAPPENVLFVCKLNPVTNDDDLEIIFSRFGKIIGCEVIRDQQSGDSLQYAFIEFADKKSCEEAYFKMDNVLIDDRRIHVDFSQSVAKMRWRGKGRGIQHYDDDGNPVRKGRPQHGNKTERNERHRSRSNSPRKQRNKNDERDRRKQDFSRNGDDRRRDDQKSNRRRERSRSAEKRLNRKERSRSRSVDKSRSKRDRSRDRRDRSRSRERKRDKRDKRDRGESKAKEEKRRKRDSSEEDRKKSRRRSRERSEEKHNKRKHKHKSR